MRGRAKGREKEKQKTNDDKYSDISSVVAMQRFSNARATPYFRRKKNPNLDTIRKTN